MPIRPVLHYAARPAGPASIDLAVVLCRGSYQARVFLNAPEADETTPLDDERFAGWLTVFGHGGCFGDNESHCAPPSEPPDPFDLRFPVGIPRQTKKVRITEALRSLGAVDEFTVTVVAVVPGEDAPRSADVLDFGAPPPDPRRDSRG